MRCGKVFDKTLHVFARSLVLLRPLILAFLVFERLLGRIVDKADLHGLSFGFDTFKFV